jgi:molecular chaperone DnaK
MGRITAIDFGTTNCIVSYFDGKDIQIAKKYGGKDQIPTVIVYPKDDPGNPELGNRILNGNKDYIYFEAFKMLLSETPESRLLKKYGYIDQYSPRKVAKDFIQLLIQKIRTEIGDIGDLYVTIPHIWEKSTNLQSKEVLKNIFEEIGFPVKRFIPEPVAAASFFCYKYHKAINKTFSGHILVVDYGGGTLDISLCKMDEHGLIVLETSGSGENSVSSIGNGGVAYDRDICLKILDENGISPNLDIDNDPAFKNLLCDFEAQKIDSCDPIRKALTSYLATTPFLNKKISALSLKFKDKELEVKRSTLYSIFDNEKFNGRLLKELDKIIHYIKINNIDTSHKNIFKVIPVGGFSSFFLVESTILKCLNPDAKENVLNDERFANANEINANERGLAISEGACAIGAGLIDLTPTVMWNVGIQLTEIVDNGKYKLWYYDVFKRGDKYDKYKEKTKLVNGSTITLPRSAKDNQFKLLVEFDGEKKVIGIGGNNNFYPQFSGDRLKYKMHCQIKNEEFFIIIEPIDSNIESKSIKINQLFELLKEPIIFNE